MDIVTARGCKGVLPVEKREKKGKKRKKREKKGKKRKKRGKKKNAEKMRIKSND